MCVCFCAIVLAVLVVQQVAGGVYRTLSSGWGVEGEQVQAREVETMPNEKRERHSQRHSQRERERERERERSCLPSNKLIRQIIRVHVKYFHKK